MSEAAVGMPHSSSQVLRAGSAPLRRFSTRVHEVPPAPAMSRVFTPAALSLSAVSREMPQPVSLTQTLPGMLFVRARSVLKPSGKRLSPSAWASSWAGLRCTARPSALMLVTSFSILAGPATAACWRPMLPKRAMSGA